MGFRVPSDGRPRPNAIGRRFGAAGQPRGEHQLPDALDRHAHRVGDALDLLADRVGVIRQDDDVRGDAVAGDQQCDHVCHRVRFDEGIGVRCRCEIQVCCRQNELLVFVCDLRMALLDLLESLEAEIGHAGVYPLPVV